MIEHSHFRSKVKNVLISTDPGKRDDTESKSSIWIYRSVNLFRNSSKLWRSERIG
jgi:hypothetical protein